MDNQREIDTLREIEAPIKYDVQLDEKDLPSLSDSKNGKVLFKRPISRRRSFNPVQRMLFNV